MRPDPNMKRQRGRNNGNGRKPHHMPVRAQTFDSSGPDVRIRGNAYQVLEKYLALARDATAAGDRIAAENFYQHAEHYYRLINAGEGHPRPQHHMQGPEPHMQGPEPHMQGPDPHMHGPDQRMGQPHNDGTGPQPAAPGYDPGTQPQPQQPAIGGPQPLVQPQGVVDGQPND
jgi:hypothetical protein